MNLYPIQTSFTGGEVSPLMYGNVDQPAYGASVLRMKNMMPATQGAATTRGAFQHVGDLQGSGPYRLFPIPVTDDIGIMGIIDQDTLRLYDRNGPIDGSGSVEILVNPDFDTSIGGWSQFSYDQFYTYAPEYISNKNTWDSSRRALKQSISNVDTGGPPRKEHTVVKQRVSLQAGKTYTIVCDAEKGKAGLIFEVVVPPSGELNNYRPEDLSGYYSTWPRQVSRLLSNGSNVFTYTPAADEEVWVCVTTAWSSEMDFGDYSNFSLRISMKIEGPPAPVEFLHPWAGLDYSLIQAKKTPGYNTVWFVHPQVAPWELVYDKTTDSWTFQEITFNTSPAGWHADNYPAAVGFVSGRAVFGGTYFDPERVDLSVAGNIYDFTTGNDAAAAFWFDLPEPGRVRWIREAKELLIGTSQACYALTARTVLSVQDYQVKLQHGYGSVSGETAIVANGIAHVTEFGEAINLTVFSDSSDTFEPVELSEFAEHLTKGYIHRIAYQREPHETLWAITREQGKLIGMAFKRRSGETQVMGWHQHDTAGRFEDIAVVPTTQGDVTFCIARRSRVTNGDYENPVYDDVYTLEVLLPNSTTLLDSQASRSYPDPTLTIDELDHLDGMEVAVVREDIVDNETRLAYLGTYQVQNNQITLPENYEGQHFYVGHAYTPEIVTLPLASASAQIQGAQKGWSEVIVRCYNSAAPLINGQSPPDRSPETPMNLSEPVATKDYTVHNLGYDLYAMLTITQDVPFRTTILALFGRADSSNY